MAVTFDELLERARKRVAEVSPARQGIPTSPAVPELHRTQFRGRPVEVPLRPDSGVDVDFAIARASEAVQRLDRPLRTLGVGGGQPTSPEDRPKPDVAGFLASIARPEAVVELEDQQGFLERSGRSILAGFGRIGSGLVRGLDEIVQAFETVYLGRHTEPGEYRYLTELANAMADPRTYGYTPTPVWDNLKTDLSEGRLWDAAKTLASGGVELAIASIPDMIFLLAAPLRAPYIASLTTQYATERMEREGRSELTWSDIAVGAATAVIVTQLEKLGAERALGVIERDGITTFVRRMWDAIRTEGLTEAGQSAVENLLVRAPSGQGITPGQFFEDILESAILGGAAGGVMRLPSATFRAIVPPAQPQEEPPPPEAPDELPPDTGAAPEVREAIRREFGRPPPRPPKAAPDQPRGRQHVVLGEEEEVYRWVAEPNRPYQQVGNEYEIVPLTEENYDRYIRPISGVDRSLAEYLRLWDERPEEVEGAKPTHVLLVRTEQEPEMRAFRVGPLDHLREYMEARERAGWFRRVDAFAAAGSDQLRETPTPTPPPAARPAPATPTPGQPPAAPPTAPEATPAQGPARVPTTITRRMREQLVDLGYTTEDIRQMTPQGAWEVITEGRQKAASAEDEELDEQMPRAIPEGMPEQEERTPTRSATGAEGAIRAVPDSVFSAFPDMAPADSGLIPIQRFTLEEQAALRAAGLVETGTLESGETHEGVDPEKLWPERERRAAAARRSPARTPTPAAPQRPAEPETRIERRDLDELAKSDEGREAMRALVDRLRSQAKDESESTVLRLGALRLQSERTRELLLEPLNQIFSRLPLEERVAITNALRSGDAAGLQVAVSQSVAPAKRTVPEVGTAPTPENLLAHYNSIEAAPAGRRFAAKLPDRIGNLLPLAQSVRSLPGLPEQDVATLNQVIAQLTRWMSAPPEKVRKGAVTTHKKVDQVSRTIKEILESLEHEFVPTGPSGRVQQIQVRKKPGAEPAALPPPAGPPVIESKKKVEPQKTQEEPWWAKEPQPEPGQKPNEELRERIYKAYTELVAEVGHDSPLIHQLHQKVGGDLDALKRELLLMGREGLAIPGRGDWSLSTPEERRAAIFLRNRVLQADINPATGEISEGAGKHTRIKIKVPERPKTPAQREIIKVKPKPVRGRQAESLLNMLGMQIEPGQGRRALEQLKTVLPGLNTKTGRVFALVPSRDAKGQLKAGAIPIPAAEKLRDLVYAHVRSGNPAITLQNLKDFLDDIGEGKALDPETQTEVLDFAEQLRSLRQRRLAEEAESEEETEEERRLREIREETEQTLEDEDILRQDVQTGAIELDPEDVDFIEGPAPQPGQKGIGVREAKAFADRLTQRWANMPARLIVTTRRDMAGVPDNLRELLERRDPLRTARGMYVRQLNAVWIFADNIPDQRQLERTIVHEILGHYAAYEYFGDSYRMVADFMLKTFPDKAREIARLYRQDLRTRKGRDIVGNEIIAFIATELEAGTATQRMRNAWERFLLWLNRQLQRLFGASFNLSDLEARDLVRQSARWARRGRGVPVGAMVTGQSAALDLQQAYHGSPREDIDRFSTEYIGTGEGAQAYGWGLYFTSKKEIAEFYRRKLSTDLVPSEDVLAEYFKPGRIVEGYSGYDRVIEFHPSVPGEREWYVTVQAVRQDESGNWVNDPTYPRPRIHRTVPKPKELERVLGKLPKRGRVYRVDIPENDELMDWDAAFEDQPQAIQDALNRMVAERLPEKADSLIKPWRTGEHIYSLLVEHFHDERARREFYGNEQEAASRLLAEYGIKGHTYMGETSGERNFVIYDDRVIEILDADLHIPEDGQGRPAPRVISGSGEADSGDMTFAEMDAPKRWQPPPSLSQITRLRVLDPTDLGMFGAVAEEANFGALVSRAEANAGSPVKAGDLLTAVSNAALRVARQQSRYSDGAYRLAAIARNLAQMAADVPVYFRNVPWHDPSGVYIEGGLGRPLGAEIRMRFGDDIKHGVTLTYGQAGPESPAALMFVLMHEVGHAATMFEIRHNPNSPAVQELTQLYERLKDMVQLEHAPWWGTPEEQLLFYNHNAWNSVAEFTTEVMTNPQFLRDLSRYDEIYRQKYEPKKTIFGKFVSVITRLLGLSPEHEQLVRLVTDAAWSVATLQQRNPQAQEYFRRLASMSRARELPNVAAPMLSERGDAEFEARIAEFGGPATAALARHGSLASRDFTSGLFGAMRKAFLALHTMDQIERRHADAFEGAAGGGNALKDLVATYRRRRAISTKLQEDAEKSFSRQWLTLGAQESARLGEVMRDSTLFQIDPTKGELEQAPEAIKRTGFERQYRKIKAAYDALTPEAKKVYNQARDYFARMRKETRRAATDLVLDSYADAARTQPTAETRRKVAEVRSLKQLDSLIGAGMPLDYGDQNAAVRRALWKVVKLTDISGPYFPLRRYGEYVVSAKEDVDETYATEAEARAALERIEDEAPANDVVVSEENGVWKVTGARYDFSLHETQAEAEREKEALAKRGIESYIGMKLDANPLGGNESAIAALMEAVNRRLAGEPEARKLVEMAFIEVMADRATYASRLRREGYSGVKGEEMRRAVAERAVGSAWNIADMRTVLAESNALKRLRKAAVDQSVDDATRIRRGLVVNELTRSRAKMIEDRSTSPLNRIISNFGYIRFLADPAYAFVNLTQTPAVAYPVIAARYGYGRTFAAMRRAYRAVTSPTIVNAIRGYARRPGDVTQYDLLSATMKALEAHPTYKKYVPALQKLIDNDVIDATFTQELLSAARGGALGHSQWQRLLEYSKLLPQGTEFLNRFVTAITVLELTGGNVEKAADMVRLTQFDYTAENRPRAFRFPGARAILMFKMYAQGIGNLLVSSFYDSIRRHSGRTEALRTLAGLIGTHSLAAGVLGGVMLEPLRWIINSVLWAVTDDEEQTPSIDTLVSNWAADVFGQKAGEIIARGVPMAVGLDMSRMSLANLIFYDRGQDWLSPEGLVSLLGPLPQVAFDAKRGVEDLQEGRYERAAARLIPIKVIADFARALELKTRGITTGAGATRIPPEEVSAFEVALTGLGFTPRRVRLDVERRRVEAERQEFLSETRGSLLRRWRQARSTAERRRIIEDVRRFNRANPSNRIRMQDLIRSQREEQRALRRSLTGRHQDRTLREQLRFLE